MRLRQNPMQTIAGPNLMMVIALITAILALGARCDQMEAHKILMPVVRGDWWKIADDNPDVEPFQIVQDGTSNTCDFTIFQDTADTWHAIACVRGTDAPGQRVFHHWTSPKLTEENWTPRGVLKWPRGTRLGQPTSVQAPHCFTYEGTYYCFYNSGGAARAMIGKDGKTWRVFHNRQGKAELFPMGRDVMIFQDTARKRWMAFYCGHIEQDGHRKAAMVARPAPALAGPWNDDVLSIRTAGNPESPFVAHRGEHYYLLQQMTVYISNTPERFEGEPLTHLTGIWYSGKWAPEIVTCEGQDYLAGYGRGLWLARLDWVPMTRAEAEEHARPILDKVRRGREAARQREARRAAQQASEK